jgi:tetratricopeptide (TPR) repeat protein
MRRRLLLFLAVFLFAAAWAQQLDPLEGRWKGTLNTQRGGVPIEAIFKKDGNHFTGTITGMQGTPVPFKEIKVDKDKINAKLELASQGGTRLLEIRFVLKGDSLQGKADLNVGKQSATLSYDLKRAVDTAQLAAPAPSATPGKPQIGQAGSPAELDEFEKLKAETDMNAKKRMIDDFVQNHPDSGLKAYALQEGAYMGRAADNIDLMSEYGEKSLEVWPENFVLMTELGNAYAHRNRVDQAEAKAEKAIELISEAQKPPRPTEEQWAQGKKVLLAMNFSTLGFVHLRRSQAKTAMPDRRSEALIAVAPFKKALTLTPADDAAFYGIGFSYTILNDYPNAESNLAKAVALNGPVASAARSLLEEIYKGQHKNSLDGLDAVIAKAKTELSIP